MVLVSSSGQDNKTYRVTNWQPMEISIVSMPLDNTVGVGRADEGAEYDVEIVDTRENVEREQPVKVFMPETVESTKPETREAPPAPQIDVGKERSQAGMDERTRIREITAVARKFSTVKNVETEADKAIQDGRSVAQFNDFILRELATDATTLSSGARQLSEHQTSPQQASSVGNHEIPIEDARKYSLVKAIRESAGLVGRSRVMTGIEAECDQMVTGLTDTHRNNSKQGFYIPEFALTRELIGTRYQRDLSTLTQGAGAFTVESSVLGTELVALLRHRMYVMAAGARYLGGLQGNILIPRHIGAGTAYWLAENASVTESDQLFGQFSLTPHTLMVQTKYSKQLLAQSSIDVEGLVRSDLNYQIALALDAAAMVGTGQNGQPIGIYNVGAVTAGVGTSTNPASVSAITFGGTATWPNVILMESYVSSLDADVDAMCYITTPLARGKWKGNSKVTNFPTFLWESGGVKWDDGGKGTDMGFVNGYRAFATNQLSSFTINAGTGAGAATNGCIFGNFNDLLIGNWAGIDVVTDPYTAAATGEIVVTIHLMADIGVRRAISFCVSTDSAAQ